MVAFPVELVYRKVHASTSGSNERVHNQRFIFDDAADADVAAEEVQNNDIE
jgi:hypothetical protein